MAKTAHTSKETGTQDEQMYPALTIRSQYIKDLSFEVPLAPILFEKVSKQPHLTVDVDIKTEDLGGCSHSVDLSLALNSDFDGKTLFILELTYAAILDLEAPEEHIEPILNIEIPTLLFPFARNIVAQCLMEGGLPPVMLNPIDFAAVYAARKASKNKK